MLKQYSIYIRRQFCIFLLVLLSLSLSGQDYLDPGKPIDVRVNDLIKQMTLAEKIAQMGNSVPAIPRLKIPGYDYWSEALHGVARQGLATVFPQAIGLGSTWDPELMEQITTVISTEARAKANIGKRKYFTFWSPTINLLRDPRWGREEEGYSEDPYLTGRMGIAFIKGMQGYDPRYLKTVATVKHFAANNSEYNRHFGSSEVDDRDLYEYYLAAFKACVKEGNVQSLMGAYNSLNRIPCCAHPGLLTNILRNDWGFNGFVVSDCDAINDIYASHQYVSTAAEAAAIAVKAGVDINCGRTCQVALPDAVTNNLIQESDIDQALKRAFRVRFLLGEFDPPEMVPYNSITGSNLDSTEHRVLSLRAARKAIVLLKNDNNILPLDINSLRSIALIGPNADKCIFGGYSGTPSFRVSPLDGIRQKIYSLKSKKIKLYYEAGCEIKGTDTSGFSNAIKIAKKSNVAIVILGTDLSVADEGKDRSDIVLPGVQEDLVKEIFKANPRTIVVLVTGFRLGINWIDEHIPGILCAWYDGQSQGTAITDVLFGDFNPGAKLTTTWYKTIANLPDIADYAIRAKNRTYWYNEKDILYPFGHGLSYTQFKYSNLTIAPEAVKVDDKLTISLDITNTGNRTGDEIVQLYIHNNDSAEKMPLKKLVGFQRITLNLGETKSFSFPLIADGETMGYWDSGKKGFVLNRTKIDVMAGSSSRDIRLGGFFQVGETGE